jgi:Sugar (and other) transporter
LQLQIRELWTRSVIVPFIISLVLMFFFQLTGINIILQFTVEIFQTAQSSVDEFQVRPVRLG